MELKDLTKDQKIQIKQRMLVERQENTSYAELSNADELISDEELIEEYGNTFFVEEDFI